MHYNPQPSNAIAEPCTNLGDALLLALRESNGLEFMPIEQRMALIQELSENIPYYS